MPGDSRGHWYSINVGLIHFVLISSEVYHMDAFVTADGIAINAPAQKAWLQADLAAVDRVATPWVIALYHRPFYCSNADSDECSSIPLQWPTNPLRVDLEPLFMEHGVDLCVEAHEHSVEMVYPLVNGTVTQKDFVNPRAPVHLVVSRCAPDDAFERRATCEVNLEPSPFVRPSPKLVQTGTAGCNEDSGIC